MSKIKYVFFCVLFVQFSSVCADEEPGIPTPCFNQWDVLNIPAAPLVGEDFPPLEAEPLVLTTNHLVYAKPRPISTSNPDGFFQTAVLYDLKNRSTISEIADYAQSGVMFQDFEEIPGGFLIAGSEMPINAPVMSTYDGSPFVDLVLGLRNNLSSSPSYQNGRVSAGSRNRAVHRIFTGSRGDVIKKIATTSRTYPSDSMYPRGVTHVFVVFLVNRGQTWNSLYFKRLEFEPARYFPHDVILSNQTGAVRISASSIGGLSRYLDTSRLVLVGAPGLISSIEDLELFFEAGVFDGRRLRQRLYHLRFPMYGPFSTPIYPEPYFPESFNEIVESGIEAKTVWDFPMIRFKTIH